MIAGLVAARAITGAAIARGLRPARRRTVAEWAEARRYVSRESGSPLPGKWSNKIAPEMVEVMECLSHIDPCRTVTLRKSAQVAGTECGINFFGHVVEDDPGPMMIVLPTGDEVKKYIKLKLQPSIDVTPILSERVRDKKSRDEDSSTTTLKKFEGGWVQITGANSSSGLQMISVRDLILEEVSEYPEDVDGRGDPVDLAIQRTQAWEGREKIFYNSTPGIAGMCRISAKYEASDQRRRYVPCPHCGVYQVLLWDRVEKEAADPAYICSANGCVIAHDLKTWMRARGVWLKCYPGEGSPPPTVQPEQIETYRARRAAGRDPGFAISGLYSPFKSWKRLVSDWRDAQGVQQKEKVFCQQGLGEPWAVKGEAPDHEKLFDRRAAFDWRRVPPGGLVLTGAADVQGDRIEWAVYAWGAAFTSWMIDKGVIEGDPNSLEVWSRLDKVLANQYADKWGKSWGLDAFAIDAGYLSNSVYRWSRRHATSGRVFAVKGMPGWRVPAIGQPSKQDVDWDGKRIGAVLLWPVGTWGMKSEIYAGIGKLLAGADQSTGLYPAGTSLYGDACDRMYCQQLTAEQVVSRKGRSGATELVWEVVTGRRNEALDIAVYARAIAHHLCDGLSPEQWAALAAQRGARPEDVQRDLAALWAPAPGAAPSASSPVERPSDRPEDDWLGQTKQDWLN